MLPPLINAGFILQNAAEKAHCVSCGMKSRRLDRFDFVSVLWYNIYMDKKYRRTKTTVSMVNYHFVFCPRYRRKIFLIDGVEARFKELVHQICEQNDIDILALECHIDHCHLFVNCPPKLSPADVMRIIKSNTGLILRKEFSAFAKVPNMWTRSYFVSTAGSVSNDTIQRYIETQKTRG